MAFFGSLSALDTSSPDGLARIERLMAHIPALLFELAVDGTTLFVNPAISPITGYTPEEMLGKNWWNTLFPDELRARADLFLTQVESGDVIDQEIVLAAKDGSPVIIAVTSSNVYRPDGKLAGIVGFGIDITARKRTEAALQESQDLFREVFQNANDAILLHGITEDGTGGRFIEVNDVACRRLGYTREELLQLRPIDISAKDEPLNSVPVMETILSQGRATFERINLTKDGRKIPVEISTHVFNLKGKRTVLSISRDIKERKRAEQLLKESEERYKGLVELATDVIYICDLKGNHIFVNDIAYARMEAEPSEVIDQPMLKWIHPDDRERVENLFREMSQTGKEIQNFEVRVISKSGKVSHVLQSVRLLYNSNGEPMAAQGIVRDITERKQYEQQLAYLATHDPLTGLPNRRLLEESIGRFVARAHRGITSALLFLDVDSFKTINDSSGHVAGDRALQIISRVLQNQLRAEDLLARLGGDEFAVLLDGANLEVAKGVAERMRQTIEGFVMDVDDGEYKLSLSIGLVSILQQQTHLEVLTQADAAMYKAKELGGNQVVVWWGD